MVEANTGESDGAAEDHEAAETDAARAAANDRAEARSSSGGNGTIAP
jgi:hypothetical protein